MLQGRLFVVRRLNFTPACLRACVQPLDPETHITLAPFVYTENVTQVRCLLCVHRSSNQRRPLSSDGRLLLLLLLFPRLRRTALSSLQAAASGPGCCCPTWTQQGRRCCSSRRCKLQATGRRSRTHSQSAVGGQLLASTLESGCSGTSKVNSVKLKVQGGGSPKGTLASSKRVQYTARHTPRSKSRCQRSLTKALICNMD